MSTTNNFLDKQGLETLVTEIKSNFATTDSVSGKMDASNPVGTGKFSMNRKSGTTQGENSSTFGTDCIGYGKNSFAEGYNTNAYGMHTHSEGYQTQAVGGSSHAEGYKSYSNGLYSHAEGYTTKADGRTSHSEGMSTNATGDYSHAAGEYTYADNEAMTAIGKYNTQNSGVAFAIGNGNAETRSDAFTVDWDGNIIASGDITNGDGIVLGQIATADIIGLVKPDGSSITIDEDGTIHSTGGGSGAVTSVNGQTGDVVLTIPTAVSELTNDSGYVTSSGSVAYATNAGAVNNHTVETDVPTGAVFTDTTYSVATTSSDGLMSFSDKTKLDGVASGATANTGTVTSVAVKMNDSVKGTITTSGTIDLGTVLTAHQDISGKANVSEAGYSLAVSGTTVSLKNKSGTVLSSITTQDTNTTYSSKSAASGGTDVSLVTTGEKYTWNNKTSNTGTVTSIATGTGLTGGTITTSGTISLASGVVTAGTAGTSSATSGSTLAVPYVTADTYGRVTGYGTHTHTISGFVPTSGGGLTGSIYPSTNKGANLGATSNYWASGYIVNGYITNLYAPIIYTSLTMNGNMSVSGKITGSNFSYDAGTSYSLSALTAGMCWNGGGFVTSGTTTLCFSVPLGKKIYTNSAATLSNLQMYVRTTGSKYLDGINSSSTNWAGGSYTITAYANSTTNCLDIQVVKSTTFTNGVNNAPVGVSIIGLTFSLTSV